MFFKNEANLPKANTIPKQSKTNEANTGLNPGHISGCPAGH